MTRPIPTSYYYSGQGRLMIGERSDSGQGLNFIAVGNVTSLTIDLAVTKFEHKENMSGLRTIDATIITEQKATIKFSTESLSLDNLALGMFGTKGTTTSTVVTNESHVYTAGGAICLKYPKVTAVTVTKGVTACVLNTDYQIDADFGTIYVIPASVVISDGDTLEIDYTSGVHDKVDALTSGVAPERFLRFEGLNSYDGSLVLVNLPRVALDPITGLEYINENFGKADFTGNILLDSTISVGSQFFTQRNIAV
jgi:hypothetical protein